MNVKPEDIELAIGEELILNKYPDVRLCCISVDGEVRLGIQRDGSENLMINREATVLLGGTLEGGVTIYLITTSGIEGTVCRSRVSISAIGDVHYDEKGDLFKGSEEEAISEWWMECSPNVCRVNCARGHDRRMYGFDITTPTSPTVVPDK